VKDAPEIRRAIGWLEARQNGDAGWGEDLRSYEDPGMHGRGTSTASQTAGALLALAGASDQAFSSPRGMLEMIRATLFGPRTGPG
jgi:squalene-hopene/tetraprenyl-beta-curcumene cyclase